MHKTITYLKLKFLILVREINHFGISPYLFFPLSIIALSFIVKKIGLYDYGCYILLFLYVTFIFSFHNNRRNIDQLKLFFKRTKCLFWIENLIVSTPFIIACIYLEYYWVSLAILVISFLISNFYIKISFSLLEKINLSVLMPDVEFIAGIRKYWYGNLLGVILVIIGLNINNFNVSVFGYTIYILTFGFYFQIIENVEWIWVYNTSAKKIIENKIKSTFLKLIIASTILILMIASFNKIFEILFYSILLFMGIVSQMLSKYAKYKSSFSIQISQAISIAPVILGFVNPIFFIFSVAYFLYLKRQAINTIKIMYAETR